MEQQEVKSGILDRVKKGKPPLQPMPDIPAFPYAKNAQEDFINHLIAFDGKAIKFSSRAQAVEWLLRQPELDASKNKIYSSCEDVEGNVGEAELSDAARVAEISACVTEGVLGVGEMGAIWVTNESLGHAPCALFARKLFILLDYGKIMGNMHDAYVAIDLPAHQYGSFYTGPSATADIEAVHITGAQGPLALTALIYNSPDAPEKPELLVNPNADTSQWANEE